MLSNPTEIETAKRELVRTYETPSYADPWEAVEDYERTIAYTAKHPNKGSQALATSLELPRSRIRPWVDDGSRPDCYRGLQTALKNDWFVDDWTDEVAIALNCLAAWVLSSGSIDDRWVPTFITAADREEIETLRRIAHTAGVPLTTTREDEDRPIEWRPDRDASALGRVLYTWLGVRGDKSKHAVRFPDYVRYAPDHIARDFARVYVQQRGTLREDRGKFVQLAATRSDRFRADLASTLARAVSEPDAIRASAWPIRIYEPALSELRQYPEWLEEFVLQ